MTKRIILAVSGSISAYKAADLTSRLKKKGYDVHVIMTEAAQAFITPLTLQVLSKNPVHTDVMEEKSAERIKKSRCLKAGVICWRLRRVITTIRPGRRCLPRCRRV